MLRMNLSADDGTTHAGEKAAPPPLPLLVVLAPAAAGEGEAE